MNKDIKYLVFGICVAFVLLGAFAGVSVALASATTIYVPDNYAKIQWAVDNASAGDTIIVKSGTYYENVVLNKSLTLQGEDFPTIDAQGKEHVFKLTTDNCIIRGFRGINASRCHPYWDAGIKVGGGCVGNIIENNILENNGDGIRVYPYSNNNQIKNNKIYKSNCNGIRLDGSSNNEIKNNEIHNSSWDGITLVHSSDNTISNNTCENNSGIYLQSTSNNNKITNNTFRDCGLAVLHSYNNEIENNTVNGKPLVYCENVEGEEVTDAGQVILVKCKDIIVRNCNLSCKAKTSIALIESSGCYILNNTCNNNGHGIYLSSSSNNAIMSNKICENNWDGILLLDSSINNTLMNNEICQNNGPGICFWRYDYSNNNTITNNEICQNNGLGIEMWHSSNDEIRNNICNNNSGGIVLYYSSNSEIGNNICNNNSGGIVLCYSSNNKIMSNTCENNTGDGIHLYSYSSYNEITNNTCYRNNYDGIRLRDSSNNTISNNEVRANHYCGIELHDFSNNNTITNNEIYKNNRHGIYLWDSSNTEVTNNTCYGNNHYGISLRNSSNNRIKNNSWKNNLRGIHLWYSSSNNEIYHNNIINNTVQAYDNTGTNSWDNGYPSGGNYWSDYNGSDIFSGPYQNITGSDGIGDTPYNINGGAGAKDNYPLMAPWGEPIELPLILSANCVAIGDADNDGDNEVVIVRGRGDFMGRGDEVAIMRYESEEWKEEIIYSMPEVLWPFSKFSAVAIGDADNDGDNEIIVGTKRVGLGGLGLSWLISLTKNQEGWIEEKIGEFKQGIVALDIGDADNDGKNEIVAIESGLREFVISYNKVGESWIREDIESSFIDIPLLTDFQMNDICIGDGNNDGNNEVIVSRAVYTILDKSLYISTEGDIFVYSFIANKWEREKVGEFLEKVTTAVTIGDGNNDEIKRIFVGLDNGEVMSYEFSSGKWEGIPSEERRYGVTDILVGDCDNDMKNELFVTTMGRHPPPWDPLTPYPSLCLIYDYIDNKWSETKIAEETGPGGLFFTSAAIGDAKNLGFNSIIATVKFEPLILVATSPVDLIVKDPDGLIINKTSTEIQNASYNEVDLNGDGKSDDIIIIPYPKAGNYTVKVIPEPDAAPTNIYSLRASLGDWCLFLANNVSISDIPEKPYTFEPTDILPSSQTLVFDTGPGTYPSIMGTHKGEIKPSCNITVSKLYTYPCPGTGGHTEYVRIWNDTWEGKEAYWRGYQHDWHNITFDEPFTLFAKRTYHYEIITGSYPQIIHKPEHT
ncbi:hypothetical protein CW714_05050, partial [Methanophagales archaeon]